MKGIHGGDIYRNQVRLDFSVNVNPLGIPDSVKAALLKAAEGCSTYPDPEAENLRQAVSRMLSVPEEWLLFGNGASELFLAAVHALHPRETVIPVPSFFGYEYAAGAVSGKITYVPMKEETQFLPGKEVFEVLNEETELLFLANPNNPTGTLVPEELLERLLTHCRKKRITVLLDECFIEFCGGENSMLSALSRYENLILIRAFTKSFAIPGVRLGYLVCGDRRLRAKIARQLPEWNLSSFAQAAGIVCAGEREFLQKTREYVNRERHFLEQGMKALGMKVFPGSADFLLLYTELPLYDLLLKEGILIRDCGNFRGLGRGYYRIAVKRREENEVLLKAMEAQGGRIFR